MRTPSPSTSSPPLLFLLPLLRPSSSSSSSPGPALSVQAQQLGDWAGLAQLGQDDHHHQGQQDGEGEGDHQQQGVQGELLGETASGLLASHYI